MRPITEKVRRRKSKCPKCHRVLRLVSIPGVGCRWVHSSSSAGAVCKSRLDPRERQMKLFDEDKAA